MSNADIAREYLETWNKRDWDKYAAMMHDGYSYTGGDGQKMTGKEAGVGVGQMFANALSDGRINITTVHETGNTVIVEFIGTGTHDGDFAGVPPTGKSLTLPVCDVIEIRDGKVYAEREYLDVMTMMVQMGVVPAPAVA